MRKTMRKTMKKMMGIAMSMFMLFSVNLSAAAATSSDYDNVQKIATKDFFNQTEDDYYVYYYMENCPFCNQVKSDMLKFAEDRSVYFVDYRIRDNWCQSYDWDVAIKKYNKTIGRVSQEGGIEYLPGESMEKYQGLKNMYGKEMIFSFEIVTEDNIAQFEGAQPGDVVANIQTPEIDYVSMTSPDELIIAGVPVLFHVVDGKIVNFYFDSVEIGAYLQSNNLK